MMAKLRDVRPSKSVPPRNFAGGCWGIKTRIWIKWDIGNWMWKTSMFIDVYLPVSGFKFVYLFGGCYTFD